MNVNILYSAMCFVGLHVMVWFSTNLQFMSSSSWALKSIWVSLTLAIPISMLAYFGSRFGYTALGDSAWGVRFLAFSLSYLTFPFMTYYFLGESMFTLKTGLCIILSCLILAIQLFM